MRWGLDTRKRRCLNSSSDFEPRRKNGDENYSEEWHKSMQPQVRRAPVQSAANMPPLPAYAHDLLSSMAGVVGSASESEAEGTACKVAAPEICSDRCDYLSIEDTNKLCIEEYGLLVAYPWGPDVKFSELGRAEVEDIFNVC